MLFQMNNMSTKLAYRYYCCHYLDLSIHPCVCLRVFFHYTKACSNMGNLLYYYV